MSLYISITISFAVVYFALVSLCSPTLSSFSTSTHLRCSCRKFADFVERTRKNAKYVGMLESIDEEH